MIHCFIPKSKLISILWIDIQSHGVRVTWRRRGEIEEVWENAVEKYLCWRRKKSQGEDRVASMLVFVFWNKQVHVAVYPTSSPLWQEEDLWVCLERRIIRMNSILLKTIAILLQYGGELLFLFVSIRGAVGLKTRGKAMKQNSLWLPNARECQPQTWCPSRNLLYGDLRGRALVVLYLIQLWIFSSKKNILWKVHELLCHSFKTQSIFHNRGFSRKSCMFVKITDLCSQKYGSSQRERHM